MIDPPVWVGEAAMSWIGYIFVFVAYQDRLPDHEDVFSPGERLVCLRQEGEGAWLFALLRADGLPAAYRQQMLFKGEVLKLIGAPPVSSLAI